MTVAVGPITNYNVENVRLVNPAAFPEAVLETFRVPLVLPNKLHKYATFSRAIGYVLCEYDETSGAVRVLQTELLPAFRGFGYEAEALGKIREDIEIVRGMTYWKPGDKVETHCSKEGVKVNSDDIRRMQIKESLGEKPLAELAV